MSAIQDRLPIELIEEIFVRCVPSDPLAFIIPNPTEAPLLLTQVCSQWRRIATSTPQLWTSLALERSRKPRIEIALILTWLSRAGALPLRLAACGDVWDNDITTILLTNFSQRCSHVRFCLHDDSQIKFWDERLQAVHLHDLVSLEIRSPLGMEAGTVKKFQKPFLTAARLRHFSWSNENSGCPVFHVPWAQLTKVSLHAALTETECLYMFQELKNVEHLVISLRVPMCAATEPIVLPHLKLFSFSVGGNSSPFFNSLCLPSLRQIGITGSITMDMSWFAKSFRSLVERSNCSIISLNLYWLTLTQSELLECISCTHLTLKELTLKVRDGLTDRFLSHLTIHPNLPGQYLCPKLEVFAVYGDIDCSEGSLGKMVQTRLKYPAVPDNDPAFVARLKVMEISSQHPEIPGLAPLRDDGLLLRIYGSGNRLEAPDGSEDMEENEQAFQKLLADGLTWFAYPSIDDYDLHLA